MSDLAGEIRADAQAFEETIGENYREDWGTPQIVIDVLAPLGVIGLDPCGGSQSIVPAAQVLSDQFGADGLAVSWSGCGLVYVNPPYGRKIGPWVDKMITEAKRGVEIVALVPGRVDTRWFGRLLDASAVVALWRGRLTFLGAPDPAKFPSVVAYLGTKPERVKLFADTLEPSARCVQRFTTGW